MWLNTFINTDSGLQDSPECSVVPWCVNDLLVFYYTCLKSLLWGFYLAKIKDSIHFIKILIVLKIRNHTQWLAWVGGWRLHLPCFLRHNIYSKCIHNLRVNCVNFSDTCGGFSFCLSSLHVISIKVEWSPGIHMVMRLLKTFSLFYVIHLIYSLDIFIKFFHN